MKRASDFSMKVSDAAAELGVSAATLRKWTDKGEIDCIRLPGKSRRYRPADIAAKAAELVATSNGNGSAA